MTVVITAAAWALPASGRALRRLSRRPRVSRDIRARIRARTRPLAAGRLTAGRDLAG